jgi:hypothetical protein
MMACFIIGTTLRSSWNTQHQAQTASPISSQAAAWCAIESHATAAFDHKRDSRLAIQSDRTRGAFGM